MKKDKKGKKVTKGPGGKEVKLGEKLNNVQVLRDIVTQLLGEMVFEHDNIDGERLKAVWHHHLRQKLEDMGERDPVSKINQLIQHGYLAYRTKAPYPISYFIFAYKSSGKKFQCKHPQAA
jgi:hypothetical protein